MTASRLNTQTYQHYLEVKQENPRLFAVEIAEKMNISEGELALIRVGFETTQLNVSAQELLLQLESLGPLKAITRNHYAVSEQIGTYSNCDFSGHAGLVLNPTQIDLRIFFSQWQHIFAFKEAYQDAKGEQKIRHSLQIFNDHGLAIHKIYATEQTDLSLWNALVEQHAFEQIQPIAYVKIDCVKIDHVNIDSAKKESVGTDNHRNNQSEFNAEFEAKWRAMTDVHQFFGLLKSYQLTRQAAFRSVSDDLAYKIDPSQLAEFLQMIQQQQNAVMFFVSNSGCVQIFTGNLEKVALQRGWLNVYNSDFTLHMQHQLISEAWITRKPTQGGIVTSLELYAEDGTQILQMYGQRKESDPEQTIWREQLAKLSPLTEMVE